MTVKQQPSDTGAYVVKRFQGDLEQVAQLARIAHSSDPLADTAYLEWKFRRNPSGAILMVCETGGQITACTALIPLLLKIKDASRLCAIGGDSLVHPQYRRRGIFVLMAQRAIEEARRDGIYMVYGSQSRGSPMYRALSRNFQMKDIGNIVALKKYLSPFSAARHLWSYPRLTFANLARYLFFLAELAAVTFLGALTSPWSLLRESFSRSHENSKNIKVSEMKPLVFDDEYERLWRETQESFSVAVVRSKQYLNWRYANPSATYIGFRADHEGRLVGYSVVSYPSRGKLKTAWVMDLLSTAPQVDTALLQQILRRMKQDGADVVMMWDCKDLRRCSQHMGFRKSWHNDRLFISMQPLVPDELIGDISNWYLTVADTEDWI